MSDNIYGDSDGDVLPPAPEFTDPGLPPAAPPPVESAVPTAVEPAAPPATPQQAEWDTTTPPPAAPPAPTDEVQVAPPLPPGLPPTTDQVPWITPETTAPGTPQQEEWDTTTPPPAAPPAPGADVPAAPPLPPGVAPTSDQVPWVTPQTVAPGVGDTGVAPAPPATPHQTEWGTATPPPAAAPTDGQAPVAPPLPSGIPSDGAGQPWVGPTPVAPGTGDATVVTPAPGAPAVSTDPTAPPLPPGIPQNQTGDPRGVPPVDGGPATGPVIIDQPDIIPVPGPDDPDGPTTVTADGAAKYWFEQAYKSSCLPSSVAGILSIFGEVQVKDTDLLDRLSETEQRAITYGDGLPIAVAERLLDEAGVPSTVETGVTIQELDTLLENGYGAIIAVDGGEVWYRDPLNPKHELVDNENEVDHVMMVTDIDIEAGLVYVNDSGSFDGRALALPLQLLLDAWADSGNTIIRSETTIDQWRTANGQGVPQPDPEPGPVAVPATSVSPGAPAVAQPVDHNGHEAAAEPAAQPRSSEAHAVHDHATVAPAVEAEAEATSTKPVVKHEAEASVLTELVKHPWIIIPAVLAVGGSIAAIAAARKA